MPIVDIEVVAAPSTASVGTTPADVADALGTVFGSAPGRTWVRFRSLDSAFYAENHSAVDATALPVFVTVLHAHMPDGDVLAAEVQAITRAVAACLARPPECVHVQYAPEAAGRQAFGGTLVQ